MSLRALPFLCLSLLATPATAQAPPLAPGVQRELLLTAAGLMRDEYVEAGTGARAAAALTALADTVASGPPRTAEEFRARLTTRLQELTGDKHVRLRPAGTASDAPDSSFGLRAAERLDDGIGYLRIDHFYRADECRAAFDAALAKLAGCRAVIVDLTANGGGSDANMLLASYFLAERTLMNRIEWRRGEPLEFWAGPSPLPALADVPLYVLTSGRTFSAAEAVAYALQQRGRAVIVGETSRGGANPNRWFPLGHGLELSVSIGRTVNPVSGTNWEGVGIRPDVAVPAAGAVAKARELIAQR